MARGKYLSLEEARKEGKFAQFSLLIREVGKRRTGREGLSFLRGVYPPGGGAQGTTALPDAQYNYAKSSRPACSL